MLKLPVCPHCNAVYRYKELISMKGTNNCYHCGKKFIVKRAEGRAVLLCVVCILLIIFNLFLFFSSQDLKITGVLTVADAIVICAAFAAFPFTVRFKAVKITKSQKKKLKEKTDTDKR